MVKEQLLNVKISCRSSSGKNKVLVQSLQAKGVKGFKHRVTLAFHTLQFGM